MPNSGSLTTDLRYDVGGLCSQEGDRLVMVAGTVTDRFGATAELCDRDSECKLVAFSIFAAPTEDAATLIDAVAEKLNKNQITGMQAVDEVTFAVQVRQAQGQAANGDSEGEDISPEVTKKREKELMTVLTIVENATEGALAITTQQTPLLQGLFVCTCLFTLH